MNRKGLQEDPSGKPGSNSKKMFAVRSCLGARMAPKSPQASILEALLIDFNPFVIVFEPVFCRLVAFFSAPAVGRGSNRKQLTIHSKLNDGCDGNALHNIAQHKNADGCSGHGGGEAEGQWIIFFGMLYLFFF